MISAMIPFADHLWQSTLFAIPVWLLVLTLRRNRAAVRHRLWLASSVKFLIPFSVLVGIGSHFQWKEASVTPQSRVSIIARTISQPFAASDQAARAPKAGRIPGALVAVWFSGFLVSLFWWSIRWGQVRATMLRSTLVPLDVPIPVMSCPERLEPGVFGIFKPVLLLPEGITERLSPAQLQAVLNHELCHIRRRDNLTAAIHMFVEALFWFHPLVWWIKFRLIDEQERACDEEVLRLGGDPHIYAESILKICEFYLTSPLICVSGISGSNLKRRIEDIMRNRVALKLGLGRSVLLAGGAIAALGGPVLLGVVTAKAVEIRPSGPQSAQPQIAFAPQGGLRGSPGTSGVNPEYRIRNIDVIGFKLLSLDVVRSTLGLVTGDVYSESRLRKGFEDLKRLYSDSGYIHFVPEPVFDFDEQRKIVDLTVHIDEGSPFTVNRIRFAGNGATPDEVIRREILVKEGEVFNASLWSLSISRLNQLGLFEEIKNEDARIQPSPNEPILDIELKVREKSR